MKPPGDWTVLEGPIEVLEPKPSGFPSRFPACSEQQQRRPDGPADGIGMASARCTGTGTTTIRGRKMPSRCRCGIRRAHDPEERTSILWPRFLRRSSLRAQFVDGHRGSERPDAEDDSRVQPRTLAGSDRNCIQVDLVEDLQGAIVDERPGRSLELTTTVIAIEGDVEDFFLMATYRSVRCSRARLRPGHARAEGVGEFVPALRVIDIDSRKGGEEVAADKFSGR